MTVWSVMPLGYAHELDLLEIKLAEQDPVVDRFVICESLWTYSGERKELHVDKTDERWAPWREKLIHVHVASEPPASFEPFQQFGDRRAWQRENVQRLTLTRALELYDLAPDDVVVISDLDEILRAQTIHLYDELDVQPIVHPEIPMHRHFLNLHWRDRMALSIARICRGSHILGDPLGVEGVRRRPADADWKVPYWNAYAQPGFELGLYGWHFSWQGGPDAIAAKLRLAAHPEELGLHNSSPQAVDELLAGGLDIQGEPRRLFWLPDDRLPVHARLPKFAHLRCGPDAQTPEQLPDFYWKG